MKLFGRHVINCKNKLPQRKPAYRQGRLNQIFSSAEAEREGGLNLLFIIDTMTFESSYQ